MRLNYLRIPVKNNRKENRGRFQILDVVGSELSTRSKCDARTAICIGERAISDTLRSFHEYSIVASVGIL